MSTMWRRLFIWLGLKCSCGGWRTIFHRPRLNVATVRMADGGDMAIAVKLRPCKRCGKATSKPTVVRVQGKPAGMSEVTAYFDPEKL